MLLVLCMFRLALLLVSTTNSELKLETSSAIVLTGHKLSYLNAQLSHLHHKLLLLKLLVQILRSIGLNQMTKAHQLQVTLFILEAQIRLTMSIQFTVYLTQQLSLLYNVRSQLVPYNRLLITCLKVTALEQ